LFEKINIFVAAVFETYPIRICCDLIIFV